MYVCLTGTGVPADDSLSIVAIDQPYEETAPACVWFDRLQMNNNDKLKIGRANAIRLFKLNLPIEPANKQ